MDGNKIFHVLERNLKQYDEIELILLKGHLIIEQLLNESLSIHFKGEKDLDRLNLMFAKKLDLLISLEGPEPFGGLVGVKNLKELNRIRNKLAHNLEFKGYHSDLKKWACTVVDYTPKTINRINTYRNMLLRAFYSTCGYMTGINIERKSLQKKI